MLMKSGKERLGLFSSHIDTPAETMSSTSPSPPFANIEGVNNLRDIGYVGDNVRRQLVYRSAFPSQASPEALQKIGDLGK